MKKITCLVAAALMLTAVCRVNATDYYPKYFINQDFNGLEALPDGWSGQTTAKYCIFNGNGGYSVYNNALKTNGSGSGNRGVDITFPAIDTTMTKEHPVIFMEFDWLPQATMTIGVKNSYGFIISGTGAIVNTTNWYTPAIFGLYMVGSDNALHYWNMDPWGSEQTDTTVETPQWGKQYGPIYQGSASVNSLNRVGTTLSNPSASVAFVDSINASTRALVFPYKEYTHSIHVKAQLNFDTQMVEALTLTQNDSLSNTVTIENMPFLAPYMIGADTTVMAREDRVVKDMSIIASCGTRASKLGNGSNSSFNVLFDNFQVYYLKESLGRRDITVVYKDQNGETAQDSKVYEQQEIGSEFTLATEDVASFSNEEFYYAFDSEATLAANPTATSAKSMPVEATSSEFIVIMKKFPKTASALTWKGSASDVWNQIDANFTAEGINALLGYQNGNSVILSGEADTINVNEIIEMGEGNLTISAPGYVLNSSAIGKLDGTGTINVQAAAEINTLNKLAMDVQTTDKVILGNTAVASAITACDGAQLAINTSTTFSVAVAGAGADASLNITPMQSNKDQEYNMAISNVGTVNWNMPNAGRLNGVRYTGTAIATYSNATDSTPVTVNVINATEEKATSVGFGAITKTGLQYANVNLDENVHICRYYNESNAEVDYFGSISGPASSKIESGWVDGRNAYYRVGGLNTDAVFSGSIEPFSKTDTTKTTSIIYLIKEGTGSWTLDGTLAFNGTIEVAGGTLDISGAAFKSSLPLNLVAYPDSVLATTITSFTVDSTATAVLGDTLPIATVQTNAGSVVYSNNTYFPDNVQIGGEWNGGASMYNVGMLDATVKLTVNGHSEGEYESIISESDISWINSDLVIKVKKATDETIDLPVLSFQGMLDLPEGSDSCKVIVNGKNIMEEGAQGSEGEGGFAFDWETGMLTCFAGPLVPEPEPEPEPSELELGDINGDGNINVGDMTGLVNLILGIPTEGLHEEVADVNEDGKINVGDCVALTNKILNTSNVASLNAGVISARVFADDFSLAAGESFDMAINFAGAENISAMQMDITLPAGLTFESARLAGSSHSLAVATLSNGDIRVLGYSSENAMMDASSLIVTVRANASAAGMGRVELGNILVAGSNAAVTGLDAAYATVTFSVQSGLESVMNEESREVYNILGQKVNGENLRQGVYVINGKKVVVRDAE